MSSTGPFFDLSTPQQAYLLGVVAAASRLHRDWFEIPTRGKSEFTVDFVRSASGSGPIIQRRQEAARVFSSWAWQAQTHLVRGKEQHLTCHWTELSRALRYEVLRGLLDTAGHIARPRQEELSVQLPERLKPLLDDVEQLVACPTCADATGSRCWRGDSALDLLGQVYGPALRDPAAHPAHPKMLKRAGRWMTRIAGIAPARTTAAISVRRLVHDAKLPSKERVSDSGYDLTLLYEKSRTNNVILYGTGLVVEPPTGWYFDLVPRSSIIKRGYLLANSVGVIDRSYRGELLVPLIKVDPDSPDLELPARIAQLIPRPIVHFDVVENGVTTSHRGVGGFGSTGE